MKKLAFLAVFAGVVTGCGGVTDSIVWLPNARPAPQASFAYTNEDSSDIQLFSSLRGYGDVTAEFDSGALPSRLNVWRAKILEAGNEVWQCDEVESSGYIPIAFPALAQWAGNLLYERARAEVMYSPASSFDAILIFDSNANKWQGMRFVSTANNLAGTRTDYAKCEQLSD